MATKREPKEASRPATAAAGERSAPLGADTIEMTRLRRQWPYFAIVVLALVAYANTLSHPFVYDDSHIARSPLLHDPWNLRAVWNSEFYGPRKPALALYRPLADWFNLLNYRLNEIVFGDGEKPFGFHVLDILLHAGVGCLMFGWLRRLRLSTSVCLIAVLLFIVHPLHTETVAPTVNRSDSQASLFGLAFLVLHMRRVPILPAVLYLCAMWSKESAVAFFPLAVAMDALFPERTMSNWAVDSPAEHRPWIRRRILDYAVLAATLALWLGLRAAALRGIPTNFTFQENPLQAASTLDRILTAADVQVRYLRLLVCPIGLSSDYSYDEIPVLHSLAEPGVLVFIGCLIGAGALAWKVRRSMPAVTLAIFGYAILFSTTSNFLLAIGTIMAERLIYMPSILFCALFAIALGELRAIVGARVIAITVGASCCLCLGLTIERNTTWKDNLTLYREQVRTAPNSAKAHVNLALALVEIGDDRGAIAEYERSLAILPYYPRTYYLLGNALHRLKEDPAKIISAYRQAIQVDPTHIDARVNLAVTLIDSGRIDEARVVVDEIRALDPNHPWLIEFAKRIPASGGRETTPPK